MDSATHPVVVQGERISRIVSDYSYKADWNDEKAYICMPAHITPGYEVAKESYRAISDVQYKDKLNPNNAFDQTQTEMYTTGKLIQEKMTKVKYAQKAKEDFQKLTQMEEM